VSTPTLTDAVVWQDVECGGYAADLPLWSQLARESEGPVLELGSGCGRVALHLSRQGHDVTGLESDPELVEELRRRGTSTALAGAVHADAAAFSLGERFGLILAPMQVLQLLPVAERRRSCLAAIAAHLRPGAQAAIAIVEDCATGVPAAPPIPDVRETDGWVYSSLPLGVIEEGDAFVVERLRQKVSPAGSLEETRDSIRLRKLTAAALEDEGREAGLKPAGRRTLEESEMHAGSVIVLLEAGGR